MKSFTTSGLRAVFAATFGVGSLVLAPFACSNAVSSPSGATTSTSGGKTTSTSSTGGECEGGFVTDAGKCVGKCEVADCVADNTCVDNQCELLCDTHRDCTADQHCTAKMSDYSLDDAGAVTDSGGSTNVTVCETSGKTPNIGAFCPLGTECGTLYACPDGTACDPMNPDPSSTCSGANCKVLTCKTTGVADAEAYCTMYDCHADTDCPDGFECAIVRDPHLICGKNPAKPSSGGVSPCVDPSTYTANGQTYQEGPISLLRNQCIKRKECAPCKTDLDCSEIASANANGNLTPTQHCVMVGSASVCTADCGKDNDCGADEKCTSGHCEPRFGACVGTGKFCEPCNNDIDCGGTAKNTMICAGLFGDQKACIDISLPDTCTTSNDCPKSPSGKHGVCFDETEQVAPGDSQYHHCYFPFTPATNKFSCW